MQLYVCNGRRTPLVSGLQLAMRGALDRDRGKGPAKRESLLRTCLTCRPTCTARGVALLLYCVFFFVPSVDRVSWGVCFL